MKYLGIDFGGKRIGLAVSDDSGTLAFPKAVLENDGTLIAQIEALCREEKIDEIVIGESINQAGEANTIQERINSFTEGIKAEIHIPIRSMREEFSSFHSGTNGKKGTDAEAAAIILQRHLDKVKYTNGRN